MHKTANVLDKLPKSVQPAAKADLREIWTAPDRATAEAAITTFTKKYRPKYEKAVTNQVITHVPAFVGEMAYRAPAIFS